MKDKTLSHTISDRKIHEGDNIDYIDHGGNKHTAIIRDIMTQNNQHYAELKHNGQIFMGVPYSASDDRHTWRFAPETVEPEEDEPEEEEDDGSTKGKQQREGASSQPQESSKAKESTQGKASGKTGY